MNQTDTQVILVPYDSGHRGKRMGAGPEFLWQNGLEQLFSASPHTVATVEIESDLLTENQTSFACCRKVADSVCEALSRTAFPLVLSGNCMISLGTIAGLGAAGLGIIWFDGHSDFWTPDMTTVGMLDGMGLAIANGRCWNMLAATIPGFASAPASHILHLGGRLNFIERSLFNQQGVPFVEGFQMQSFGTRTALQPALDALRRSTDRIYLHLDLDVLDPALAKANEFARPDGLTVDQLDEAIQLIATQFTICGCGIASYDPASDENKNMAAAVQELIFGIVSG